MKRFICILMALFMLACAVSCTKTDENGGATTVGGTTADVTTTPDGTTAEQTTTPDETTAEQTTAEETTADPVKKAIEEAIAHIGKKEYYAAYDLLNAHLDNEDAQKLLRNFRFICRKSLQIPALLQLQSGNRVESLSKLMRQKLQLFRQLCIHRILPFAEVLEILTSFSKPCHVLIGVTVHPLYPLILPERRNSAGCG